MSTKPGQLQADLLVKLEASPYNWLDDRGSILNLHGAIDDATRVDAFHFSELVDLGIVRQFSGVQAILCGNVDGRKVMLLGGPKDVDAAVTRIIQASGTTGDGDRVCDPGQCSAGESAGTG